MVTFDISYNHHHPSTQFHLSVNVCVNELSPMDNFLSFLICRSTVTPSSPMPMPSTDIVNPSEPSSSFQMVTSRPFLSSPGTLFFWNSNIPVVCFPSS